MFVPASNAFSNFLVGAVIVAALYFTRELLVPIALAVLLSFVLAPPVRALQRWRLPRSIAVLGAVSVAGYHCQPCGDGDDRGQPACGRPSALSIDAR